MEPSLRSFLHGLVDYAGLFPPASLDLDTSIGNFLRYRRESRAFMLGRFICPAGRLRQLDPLRGQFSTGNPPVPFSVLGRRDPHLPEFLAGLEDDLALVNEFLEFHQGNARVEAFETVFPEAALLGEAEADSLAGKAVDLIRRRGPAGLELFFEVLPGSGWKDRVRRAAAALAPHEGAGLKVRTGGTEAAAIPSPRQVAQALVACRDAEAPFKATAGLHHPLRHTDSALQAKMHGFFNVFGAAILAYAQRLGEARLLEILEDEKASSFSFGPAALAWRDHQVALADVERARARFATSFGSCSFDEPCQDLEQLGLL